MLPKITQWVAALDKNDSNYEHNRLEALWATWELDKVDQPLLRQVLKSPDFQARAAAVRVVRYTGHQVADQADLLMQAARDDNVRAMFDTHHANMEEKHFPDALKTIAPVLAHVHTSENDRGTPGSGHIPWDDTFRTLAELDYTGWMTIEAFTRNDVDFANSINVWREFSQPWDIAENGYKFIKMMQEKYAV